MQCQQPMRRGRLAPAAVCSWLVCTGSAAAAVDVCESDAWCDTFETYELGLLIGQDCIPGRGHECDAFEGTCDPETGVTWMAWDNDPNVGLSEVTPGPGDAGQVVAVGGPDDLVKTYKGLALESGRWQLSAQMYIPDDYEGLTYFILLNTFDGGNTGANWSTQLKFDSTTDAILSDFDDGEQNEVTFTRGAWKEVRVVIDLDDESSETGQRIYYDDRLIIEKSWVDGVSGGGQSRLEAMDLFGNAATPVYWDNFRICRLLDCPGDLDADEAIGLSDLVLLLEAWGDEDGPADIDGSGRVDFNDLLIVLDGWGPCPG